MAIPPDQCADFYRGLIGTISPMSRINHLIEQARNKWTENDRGSSDSPRRDLLIFDAMTKLIVSLEIGSEAESKTMVCTAMGYLMAYLHKGFDDSQLQPMLQRQAELQNLKNVPSIIPEEPEHEEDVAHFTAQKSIYGKRRTSCSDSMMDKEMLTLLHMSDANVEFPRFFIDPSSMGRILWDVWVLMIVLIDSVLMPYQIAYHFDDMGENAWFWIGTSIFTIDILANFVTGYIAGPLEKDHGKLVVSRRRIAKHYLLSWFLIDFLSTFPWSWVMAQTMSGDESDGASGTRVAKVTKVAKLARFMRLARMLKLLKLQDIWDAMENSIGSMFAVQVLNLLKVIAVVVYICHWNACIWWAVGSTTSIFNMGADETSEDSMRPEKWTTKQLSNTFVNKNGEEWTRTFSWADEDIERSAKYTFCFYWTLGVMRTMPVEVYPVSRSERLYTLIFMFFAFSMFSICISRITQMYNKLSTRRTEFEENLAAVRSYMHEHDIEKGLQERIRTFLEYRFARRRIFAKENGMFNELTETLRTELKCAQFVRTLQTLWIFKDLPNRELKPIVLICQVEDTSPGDVLALSGTIAQQASIIISGKLTMDDPAETAGKAALHTRRNISAKGSTKTSDGVMSVDSDCLLFKGETLSESSIWAEDFCEIAVLDKGEFLRVRRSQPKINTHLDNLMKSQKGIMLSRIMKRRGNDAGLASEAHMAGDWKGSMSFGARRRLERANKIEESEEEDVGSVVQALG